MRVSQLYIPTLSLREPISTAEQHCVRVNMPHPSTCTATPQAGTQQLRPLLLPREIYNASTATPTPSLSASHEKQSTRVPLQGLDRPLTSPVMTIRGLLLDSTRVDFADSNVQRREPGLAIYRFKPFSTWGSQLRSLLRTLGPLLLDSGVL